MIIEKKYGRQKVVLSKFLRDKIKEEGLITERAMAVRLIGTNFHMLPFTCYFELDNGNVEYLFFENKDECIRYEKIKTREKLNLNYYHIVGYEEADLIEKHKWL